MSGAGRPTGVEMRDGAIEKWEEVMAGFYQSAKKHDANPKKAGKMKTETGGQPFPQELVEATAERLPARDMKGALMHSLLL